jgi:hypothetical protein
LAAIAQSVIATRYGLDGPEIESRMRRNFSAPVQTGPGAHTVSYTMGNGPFPREKRLGSDVDHPHSSSAEVKERVELYLYSSCAFIAGYRMNFNFFILSLLVI